MGKSIQDRDLVLHFLNVGRGDAIVIEFPVDRDGKRRYGVVDCHISDKVIGYLERLSARRPAVKGLEFVCATHPHSDHIRGIPKLLRTADWRPRQFWDSGFRHHSLTYRTILQTLHKHDIELIRVSSGMEWGFCQVRVTALAPSVALRNRYATYGIDINNASIVLRLENHDTPILVSESELYDERDDDPAAKTSLSVAILGGDAEFDSWAQINAEYPVLHSSVEGEATKKRRLNLLNCSVLKVPHHGSMHGGSLDMYERMSPSLAIISTEQEFSRLPVSKGISLRRGQFPHPTAVWALQESKATVVTTDGSFESAAVAEAKKVPPEGESAGGSKADQRAQKASDRATVKLYEPLAHPGSVVVVMPPGGRPRWAKLGDGIDDVPEVISKV